MCLQNKIIIHGITIDYIEPEHFYCDNAIASLEIKIKRLNRLIKREHNLGKRAYYVNKVNEYKEQLDLLVEELRKCETME